MWDKTGIVEFSKSLVERGFEILSTGGTKSLLEQNDIPVTSVSDLTGFGSIMDGRVKTLHPKVFGGILADRKNNSHISDLLAMDAFEIDLVVVNLYPFVEQAIQKKLPINKAIEFIDIGGPSMLRAAAKNHESVIPLCDSSDYEDFISKFDNSNGQISIEHRQQYAAKIFEITTQYDMQISSYLMSDKNEQLTDKITINAVKKDELRYGENPHQKAAFYTLKDNDNSWSQLQGKQLSYNNYTDIESALSLIHI